MAITMGAVEVRDPSERAFAVAYREFAVSTGLLTIGGTSETPVIFVTNPSSNVNFLVSLLRKVLAQTVGHTALFNFYANPTVSANGTALTPVNKRVDSGAPASSMLAYKSPTVSANGSLIGSLMCGNASVMESSPLALNPNQSLLVTVQVSNASDKVQVDLEYHE